jgi:hypothetical protein
MKTAKIVVALYLSETRVAELPLKARNIVAQMTGNKSFPEADFKDRLSDVTTAADDLDNALQLPASNSKADVVQGARITLEVALKALGNEVEAFANRGNLDLEDRLALVHGAGLEVRSYNGRKKRTFAVEQGKVPGSVTCYASAEDSVAHQWQMAADVTNLENRVELPVTTKSMAEVSGLKAGNEYAFYHKPVKAGVETAWEGPIFVRVI